MIWLPYIIAVLPVAFGATLALAPGSGSRWLRPIRVFALTAALGVIALHLLPEAWHKLDGWALLVGAAGFGLPAAVNRWVSAHSAPLATEGSSGRGCMGLEVGFAGLLLHRAGDGLALAAVAYSDVGVAARAGVYAALTAHAVPVAAVLCLVYQAAYGRRTALLRAGLLAIAGCIGVLVARLYPLESLGRTDAYVAALVAGLLLHVVSHDLREVDPRRASRPGLSLAAALCGASVGVIGSLLH
jgi:zinc transporter ZupT